MPESTLHHQHYSKANDPALNQQSAKGGGVRRNAYLTQG
jgi:hypothetical protein